LKAKKYLYTLFLIFTIIFGLVAGYLFYYKQKLPPSLTENIYFDSKLKFIKDKIDIDSIDTIIIGSSVGLNNIRGEYLQTHSKVAKGVLNLSVNGAYTRRASQILKLTEGFSNLKRVIYSVQYTDLGVTKIYKNFNKKLIIKYIRGELNPIENWLLWFNSCNDLLFCINRQKSWKTDHDVNNSFTSLRFDSEGSVPLYIYGKDIHQGRWKTPQPGFMPGISYKEIEKMIQYTNKRGIKFYLIQQVYREPIVKRDKRVKDSLESFAKEAEKIARNNDAYYLNLYKELSLSDKYFADRNHLNDQGSILTAIRVAKFIDKIEYKD